MDVIQSQGDSSLKLRASFMSQTSVSKPDLLPQRPQSPQTENFAPNPEALSLKTPIRLEEILEYFSTHSKDEMLSQVEDFNQGLLSQEDFDQAMLSQMFGFDDEERQGELRQILQELDRANDLERLLFGEDLEEGSEDYFQLFLNFEFRLQIQSKNQSQENDGERIEVSMSGAGRGARQEADPLVFDLDGDGIETTGIDDGVFFDLDGDGVAEKTSFVSGDDFVLSRDHNGNGRIDSGKELFGDANGARDGIEELKRFDLNRDGVIDRSDPVFKELRLFNRNRRPLTLNQAGVEKIDLNRLNQRGFTSSGDRFDGALEFELTTGEKRKAQDIYFRYRNT
jgi:hypothetical protein